MIASNAALITPVVVVVPPPAVPVPGVVLVSMLRCQSLRFTRQLVSQVRRT